MTMEIKGSNILLSLFVCLLVYGGIDYVSHNSIINPLPKSVDWVSAILLLYIMFSGFNLAFSIRDIIYYSFKNSYQNNYILYHLCPITFISPIFIFLFKKVKDWLDYNLTIKI
jgi:hypothetical protein